jgi:hypothetical protein
MVQTEGLPVFRYPPIGNPIRRTGFSAYRKHRDEAPRIPVAAADTPG